MRNAPSIFAALAVGAVEHRRTGKSVATVIEQLFPEQRAAIIVAKAAQNPADTQTPEWAGVLVQDALADYAATSLANSLFTQLSAMSVGLPAVNGRVRVPARDLSKRLKAAWVAEGKPLPVSSASLSLSPLVPGHVGVLTILSDELVAAGALPTLEAIVAEDIAAAVDAAVMDDTEGGEANGRPSGLLYGAVEVPATGDLADDLASLLAAVPALSMPVFVFPFTQLPTAAAAGLLRDGLMAGLPYIATGATDAVVLLDMADVLMGMDGVPEVSVTNAATVHMEDTAPLPIVDDAGTVASPVTSLWQQGLTGIRSVVPSTWLARTSGRVAVLVPAAP